MQAAINDAQNVSFGHVLPGVQSTVLDLYTVNGIAGYSTDFPLSIGGTTISKSAFLAISPQEVDFGSIVVGSGTAETGISGAVIVSNLGNQVLTFSGFAWDEATESDVYHNLTTGSDGLKTVGNGFTSSSFPNVGDSISVGGSITVPLNFKANTVGSYSSILTFYSNGGDQYVLLVGSASTSPIANISVSTSEGGWDNSAPLVMDFGSVLARNTTTRSIRICNSGGSALTVTKSKVRPLPLILRYYPSNTTTAANTTRTHCHQPNRRSPRGPIHPHQHLCSRSRQNHRCFQRTKPSCTYCIRRLDAQHRWLEFRRHAIWRPRRGDHS